MLVDVSKDGHPAYIKDFANVERRYQDPTFMVRYDGEPCLLLSVEMQKGKNIVELGEQLDTVFQAPQGAASPRRPAGPGRQPAGGGQGADNEAEP